MVVERVALVSGVMVAVVRRRLRVGESGSLSGNSGVRGEVMRLPRAMAPVGGLSRVGARKYVFLAFILGFILEKARAGEPGRRVTLRTLPR